MTQALRILEKLDIAATGVRRQDRPDVRVDAVSASEFDVYVPVGSDERAEVTLVQRDPASPDQRAALKKYYDDDSYQLVLTPDTTGMKTPIAVTAWNRDPVPNGTGRLMTCPQVDDATFTAIESFKDEHRSRGPEPVP